MQKQPTDILPTLFGEGYGTYAVQSRNFYTSILLHTVALALFLYVTHQVVVHRAQKRDHAHLRLELALTPGKTRIDAVASGALAGPRAGLETLPVRE